MGNGADLFCDFSKILILAEQDGHIVQVMMSQPYRLDGNSDINAFLFTDGSTPRTGRNGTEWYTLGT